MIEPAPDSCLVLLCHTGDKGLFISMVHNTDRTIIVEIFFCLQ